MSFRLIARLVGFAALLTFASSALKAQMVTFTVYGTINSAGAGYTSAQEVSFTFYLKSFGGTTPVGSATASNNYSWEEEHTDDPEIFASVSGTGITGTWTRPSTPSSDPYSGIYATAAGRLTMQIGSDSGTGTGLLLNGQEFNSLSFSTTFTDLNFDTITSTLPDPTSYFSATLAGSYEVETLHSATLYRSDSGGNDYSDVAQFTVTGLTITAVPEPSTYVLLAGVIVLAGATLRRRRLSQTTGI